MPSSPIQFILTVPFVSTAMHDVSARTACTCIDQLWADGTTRGQSYSPPSQLFFLNSLKILKNIL
jgi:hypothetical protein